MAVVKHGNFSEAALSLEVSQSAVSHAIASLEAQLGIVLLSRGRHGATLTPVGEDILDDAQEILRLVEAIGHKAILSKGLAGGQVRIASFRSVATHVLPRTIAEFRQRFPGITITLVECQDNAQVEQALREGRADVGFFCRLPPDDFETWELVRDEMVALLPPHIKVANNQITWEQLATLPLIMPPQKIYCCANLIRDYLISVQRSIQAAYEIQESSTIVSMVMQGLGAAVVARLSAEPLPPTIQVCRLPVALERIIRVAVLAKALHPPAVYAFLDALKEQQATANAT